MGTLRSYISLIFISGFFATWFLAVAVFDMGLVPVRHGAFWYLLGLFAIVPALLAALTKRTALIILCALLSALGILAYRASFATDDGGLAMGIVIVVAITTGLFGALAIGLRGLFVEESNT